MKTNPVKEKIDHEKVSNLYRSIICLVVIAVWFESGRNDFMRNLKEIIKEIDSWDGTDERIICTWLRWGEVKLLAKKLLQARLDGDNFEDDVECPCIQCKLNRKVKNNNLNSGSTRHFEEGVDGGCGCVKCEKIRLDLYDKHGYNDSSWAEQQILELLKDIKFNTRYRSSITVKSNPES